jgi:O-antigen ligase
MRILLASIYPYTFFLLYLLIPFDEYIRALPNILLGIIVIVFPFIVTKNDFKKLGKIPVLLFLAFFAFLVLNSLFFGRIEEDFYVLKKIIIAVGLVILYIPVADFEKIDKAIIFSAIAAMLFSIVNIFLLNDISSFEFKNPIDILLIDRLYLGLLSVLSILVSYKALKPRFHPNNQFYVANIFLNIVFIFVMGSRVAIVILLTILLLRQFYGPHKKLRLLIAAGLIAIASVFTFASSNNFVKNYMLETDIIGDARFDEKPLHSDFRTLVWDCGCDLVAAEWSNLFGSGFKTTNVKLADCYNQRIEDDKTEAWFESQSLNTHNQFLDFYLSSGLVGILFFVGIILFLFRQHRNQFFPVASLLTIVLFGLTENFLHRQIGAYFFGFALIILLSNVKYSQKEIVNQEKKDT